MDNDINASNSLPLDDMARFEAMLDKLTPFDDLMMRVFFDDREAVEVLVRAVTRDPLATVVSYQVQADMPNLAARSAVFDVVAKDSQGRYFNFEVQRLAAGASPRRARYHGALMTTSLLAKSDEWMSLPDTWVVFLAEGDVFRRGLQSYQAETVILETGELFDDGMHIVYVNGAMQDDTPLGRIVHDLRCAEPEDAINEALASRLRYCQGKEGRKRMTGILAEVRDEGIEQGIKQGEQQNKEHIACSMILEGGFTDALIAKLCALDEAVVSQLRLQLGKA